MMRRLGFTLVASLVVAGMAVAQEPCGTIATTSLPTNGPHFCPGNWIYHHNPMISDPAEDVFLLPALSSVEHPFRDTVTGSPWHIEFQLRGGASGNAGGVLLVKIPAGGWSITFPPLASGADFFRRFGVPDTEIRWAEVPELGIWKIRYTNTTTAPILVDGGISETRYLTNGCVTEPHSCLPLTPGTSLPAADILIELIPGAAPLLITEVGTGMVDWIEVCNRGTVPVSLPGITLVVSDNSVCPPASTMTYTLTGAGVAGGMLAPYAHYLIEELGVAGGPSTVAPNGERTGFEIPWSGASNGEVALHDASGTGADYLPFLTTGTALADGFRNNPFGDIWLSGPVVRISGQVSIRRLRCGTSGLTPYAYCDFGVNADWNAETAAGTPGTLNPTGGMVIPITIGCDFGIRAPAPGAIELLFAANDSSAGAPVYNFFSLLPTACAGSGPYGGLESDILSQALLPFGTAPFSGILTSAGDYYFAIPSGVPPGFSFEARSAVILPGPVATILFSNFVYLTT